MRKLNVFLMIVMIIVVALSAASPALAGDIQPPPPPFIKNLNVNATASGSWTWDIAKTSQTTDLQLSPGQTATVNYAVTVTGTKAAASGWQASGDIVITHPSGAVGNMVVNSLVVDFGNGITVNTFACDNPDWMPFPFNMPPDWTINCTYTANLPDTSYKTATVTAETNKGTLTSQASVVFGALTGDTGKCINVEDSLGGSLGQVCGDSSPTVHTFNYAYTVGPYNTCGDYELKNIASIVENGKNAFWTIDINVPCGGCTLTQGYWKTHSRLGPAPYDDAWTLIGPAQENTAFFLSGKTWYQVFWTAPAGNAYYILAHQYMAAKLNVLNGASAPSAVTDALASAEALFNTIAPSGVNNANKGTFNSLAGTLDRYNNGLIGPGHCSE